MNNTKMVKKYLYFKAYTNRTNYDVAVDVRIPIILFEDSYLLDNYVKGLIYSMIQCDNELKYRNRNIFIKIVCYSLEDIKKY